MTHVTCRLTAKNRDQLRNATLGNRVWATFSSVGKYRCAIYIFFFIKRDVYSEKNQVNRRKIVHQSCNPYSARVKKWLRTQLWWHLDLWFRRYARGQTDTYTQTRSSQYSASLPGKEKIKIKIQSKTDVLRIHDNRERKCADTIGTLLVPSASHFQC